MAKTNRRVKRDREGNPVARKPGAGKDQKREQHKEERSEWKKRRRRWQDG